MGLNYQSCQRRLDNEYNPLYSPRLLREPILRRASNDEKDTFYQGRRLLARNIAEQFIVANSVREKILSKD